MKALSVVFLLVVAIGLTLSGCSDKPNPVEGTSTNNLGGDPLGKATVVRTTYIEDVDTWVDIPCTGDEVYLSGEIHYTYQTTYDSRGGTHDRGHATIKRLTGISLAGVEYHTVGAASYVYNINWSVGGTYSSVQRVMFVAPGPGNDLVMHFHQHWTYNAKGELIVNSYVERVECK